MYKRIVVLSIIAVSSPIVFLTNAGAETSANTVGAMVDMLHDIFLQVDPKAAEELAKTRNAIPKEIQTRTKQIGPQLQKNYDEIKMNVDDHYERTNHAEYGIPLGPNTAELLALLQTLVDATYQQSFNQLVADGYTPYIDQLTHIKSTIAAPTDGSPPPLPPTDALVAGIAFFQAQANAIRAGAEQLGNLKVSDSSSALDLQHKLEAAQGTLATFLGRSIFVDGAVEGLINSLSRMKERAVAMQGRPDHENDIYDQKEADGLVDMANNILQQDAKTPLLAIADYTDSIIGELKVALDSIVLKTAATPGETARQIVDQLLPIAIEKQKAAQAAANAAAANVAAAQNAVNQYWEKNLYATRIHCHWENKSASSIAPLYGMVDQYNNLNKPEELLKALNSDLWSALKSDVLAIQGTLNKNIENQVSVESKKIAAGLNLNTSPPLEANVPQMRFSGECGEYAPDPTAEAAVFTHSDNEQFIARVAALTTTSRRATREAARQSKGGSKKKAPLSPKAQKKLSQKASRTTKKYVNQIWVGLNRAYFKQYGKYPALPFVKRAKR